MYLDRYDVRLNQSVYFSTLIRDQIPGGIRLYRTHHIMSVWMCINETPEANVALFFYRPIRLFQARHVSLDTLKPQGNQISRFEFINLFLFFGHDFFFWK